MRIYPDQPKMEMSMEAIKDIIEDTITEELPECITNRWFLGSVGCANMLDKIMEKIWSKI